MGAAMDPSAGRAGPVKPGSERSMLSPGAMAMLLVKPIVRVVGSESVSGEYAIDVAARAAATAGDSSTAPAGTVSELPHRLLARSVAPMSSPG